MSSFEIAAKLLSDLQQENHLTNKQVVEELKSKGICVSVRMINYYIYHGIIRRPSRIGRAVYHRKDYVLNAIVCFLILKNVFLLTSKKAKSIMCQSQDSIDVLLEKLVSLDKNMDYLQLKETLC